MHTSRTARLQEKVMADYVLKCEYILQANHVMKSDCKESSFPE